MSPESAEQFLAEPPDTDLEVFPENWPAVQLFLTCETQWRYAGDHPAGLDYAALAAVMDINGTKDRVDTLHRVRALEAAAIKELRSRRKN